MGQQDQKVPQDGSKPQGESEQQAQSPAKPPNQQGTSDDKSQPAKTGDKHQSQ